MRLTIITPILPKPCGLASFSAHLATVLVASGGMQVEAVSVIEAGQERNAGVIRKDYLGDYAQLARDLNDARPDIVLLQHEYGIFGGPDGRHVLSLVRGLRCPLATVLHTVLPHPNPHLRDVTAELVSRSGLVVVMCQSASNLLRNRYAIDIADVHVLPHGSPVVGPQPRPQPLRGDLSERGPLVVALGLLGPDKGIDTAIVSMGKVIQHVPGATLCVVGSTHPGELEAGVDRYRQHLQSLVRRDGLENTVLFFNGFLCVEDHVAWIQHADVVLTLHRDLGQVSSGTLTYAVAAGRAVVSTPFAYARDLACAGAGVFFTRPDAADAGQVIVDLLIDGQRRAQLMRKSSQLGPSLTWPQVGAAYRRLLRSL